MVAERTDGSAVSDPLSKYTQGVEEIAGSKITPAIYRVAFRFTNTCWYLTGFVKRIKTLNGAGIVWKYQPGGYDA